MGSSDTLPVKRRNSSDSSHGPLVEAVPRLGRQSLPQIGILLLKILQMRRDRVQRRALDEVATSDRRDFWSWTFLWLNWPRVGVFARPQDCDPEGLDCRPGDARAGAPRPD